MTARTLPWASFHAALIRTYMMTRSAFLTFSLALLTSWAAAADKPNILWLTFEDSSPHLGCYGDKNANTPVMDGLATRGLRYKMAWSNAPVCAPARTCIISGRWAPADGSEHMRSEVPMPQGHKMYPQLLREAGYYCTNNSKEDYNLVKPDGLWDESSNTAHWKNRAPGQPFFAIFNNTKSHESQIRARPHSAIHDPAKVEVPPYHPDTPEVRQDWAQHFDNFTAVDTKMGQALAELAEAGLAEDTIVFAFADHGTGMPRSKRWTFNSGLRVPFIVHFPEKWRHLAPKDYAPGAASDRLVSFIDLAPTLASIVGMEPPAYFQGRAFAGTHAVEGPKYIFGFRGRMDERYDMMRSATDGRYVYVRHFYPHLPEAQHVNYMFLMPTAQVWQKLFTEGKLNAEQASVWKEKPSEQLFDLQTDRWEVKNLAADPAHQAKLAEMRSALTGWMEQSRDLGFVPEGERVKAAAGRSPKDHFASDTEFPAQEVIASAQQATDRSVVDASALLDSPQISTRFWGAQGILMRGADAVKKSGAKLEALLSDESKSVQNVAAEALGRFGDQSQQAKAWQTLLTNAAAEEENSVTAAAALNAIDHMSEAAKALHKDALAKLSAAGNPTDPGRLQEYPARLHEYLGETLGYASAKPKAQGKKGKGKKPKAKN